MPEGPEVHTICDKLHAKLAGKVLLSVRVGESYYGNSKIRRTALESLPQFLDKLPCKLQQVKAIGKRIVFIFEKNMYLVSFLAMAGHWSWDQVKHTKLWLDFGTQSGKIKIISTRAFYSDSRPFGAVYSFPNVESYTKYISAYGPDPLNEEILPEVWLRIFRSSPNRQICVVLTDQNKLSSVGNYLKAEILYAAKIRPDRLVRETTDEQLLCIREHTYRIIWDSYKSQGLTIQDYWDPDGKKGDFQVLIYKKKQDPSGNEVVSSEFRDGRTTWWVPAVQK